MKAGTEKILLKCCAEYNALRAQKRRFKECFEE
jgi:hypothetical protein